MKNKIMWVSGIVLGVGFFVMALMLYRMNLELKSLRETSNKSAYCPPKTYGSQSQKVSTPMAAFSFQRMPQSIHSFSLDDWDPFDEMDQIQGMMNRMFRDSMTRASDHGFGGLTKQPLYEPNIDFKESPTHYILHLDLPGMDKDKINIVVKNHVLTVSGERTQEKEESNDHKGAGTYRMERSFGAFSRSFALPEDANSDGLTAENKNGVLTIKIPKLTQSKQAQEKKVAIQ